MKTKYAIIILVIFFLPVGRTLAQTSDLPKPPSAEELKKMDTDGDGLNDYVELNVYHTNPRNPDTDGDGYSDGEEVANAYDPNQAGNDKLQKSIVVVLADQSLSYRLGDYIVGSFKISSGLPGTPTPPGEYTVLKKVPVVDYKGSNYDFKNTKWNLMFKKGTSLNFYIHGAYWHHNFGHPMSHGCINVAYSDMEGLYNWADAGIKVIIQSNR